MRRCSRRCFLSSLTLFSLSSVCLLRSSTLCLMVIRQELRSMACSLQVYNRLHSLRSWDTTSSHRCFCPPADPKFLKLPVPTGQVKDRSVSFLLVGSKQYGACTMQRQTKRLSISDSLSLDQYRKSGCRIEYLMIMIEHHWMHYTA